MSNRDQFRTAVFQRDRHLCVICGKQGQDAHHIIERRLFPDGGYYLDNGATLCGQHHIDAETTLLTCEDIRERAGIKSIVLPPHLYPDQRYDKWGNPILPNGQRLRGELFQDESVQKILQPVLNQFTDRVKYPRTWHLPCSPGVGKDDRVLTDLSALEGEVIITEKMDGENTTLYRDYLHARSIDYNPHPSRGWIRAFHARICYDIPEGWRVCGENLYAKHSIGYESLPSYFLGFSIWDHQNNCLSWDETLEWFGLLGIQPVPAVYRGPWSQSQLDHLIAGMDHNRVEGFVVRRASSFTYRDFRTHVAKYVRQGHVQTHGGWMRQAIKPNGIIQS